MDWNGKRVFITGAGGFIGSHLTEALLEKGASVTALVRYNSRNHHGWLDYAWGARLERLHIKLGDIRDGSLMDGLIKDNEFVFHLAALIGIPYSYRAPHSYLETNIHGTMNVMEAALRAGVQKLIVVSTSEVYGTARYTPIDEHHPLQAQSPYSASKIGAEKLAESFHRSYNLPLAIIRPFNTYGPRQSARAVIPAIISQALAGEQLSLGNLDPVRDLTYVTDTADGLIKAAESPNTTGETINLGTGNAVSIRELVEVTSRLMGTTFDLKTDATRARPAYSEVEVLLSDPGKAANLMGWKATISLAEGLKRTIDWMKANQEHYRKKEFVY